MKWSWARLRWRLMAITVGGAALWQLLPVLLVPRMVAHLAAATGHRAEVGSVALRWRKIVARDVVLFGAPPFEKEPLMRLASLTVRFGGPGLFDPVAVNGSGVEISLLGGGSITNRHSGARILSDVNGRRRPLPACAVDLDQVRLAGIWQTSHGPRVILRAGPGHLTRSSRDERHLDLPGLVLEVAGLVTVSVPRLQASQAGGGGVVTAQASDVSLLVPGFGPWLANIEVEGKWGGQGGELQAQRPFGQAPTPAQQALGHPGQTAPAVHGSGTLEGHLRWNGGALQAEAHARGIALGPLTRWTQESGLFLASAKGDLDGTISRAAGGGAVAFDLSSRLVAFTVNHPAVDRHPWEDLTATLQARGVWDPAGADLMIEEGGLETMGLPLQFEAALNLSDRPRGSIKLHTSAERPLPCAGLVAALPGPVRETLAGLQLAGNLGVKAALDFDSRNWDTLSLDLAVDPVCLSRRDPDGLLALLAVLQRPTAPATPRARSLPLGTYHPDFTPLSRLPDALVAAFVTAEDGHFFTHHGFDADLIRKALVHDLEIGSFARGASTLTQQLAKNLFLPQDRTLARKWEEMVFTWRLDHLLDKRRVLELYLNLIELGPGIRGVKQAARSYFGKDVRDLNPLEAAHLAALTPNPSGFSRRFRDGQVDEGWLHKLYDLLAMMKRSGRISTQQLAQARATRLTLRKI